MAWTYVALGVFVAFSPDRWRRWVMPAAQLVLLHACVWFSLMLGPALIRGEGGAPLLVARAVLLVFCVFFGWALVLVLVHPSEKKAVAVARVPGHRTHRLVTILFSRRTCERVFEPIVADHQQEYFEALAQGETLRARWIGVRLHLDLGLSAVVWVATRVRAVRDGQDRRA